MKRRSLFIICGPTSTGKTSLALSLAGKFQGELISADSRQVYQDMTIGTGKDLPKSALRLSSGAYSLNDISLWGYDLVSPLDSFSVSQYLLFARDTIKNIWQRNHTPILVGGTGFYIKAVLNGLSTAHIPPDQTLRDTLSSFTPEELYTKLSLIDSEKAISLNSSDKKNPMRLIRAIEVSQSVLHSVSESSEPLSCSPCFIGLTASPAFLKDRITSRVNDRFMQNMEQEVRTLLSKGLLVPGSGGGGIQ
jgi:tRNA dimethylallyltransferase